MPVETIPQPVESAPPAPASVPQPVESAPPAPGTIPVPGQGSAPSTPQTLLPIGDSGGWVLDKTVYVSQASGDDATGQRNAPRLAYLTLTAAFTAALAGDTVIILDGTYHERNVGKHLVDQYWMDGATLIGTFADDYDAGDPDCSLLLSSGSGDTVSYAVKGEGTFTVDATGDTAGDSTWKICATINEASDVSIECKAVNQIRTSADHRDTLPAAFAGPGLDTLRVTGTLVTWGTAIADVWHADIAKWTVNGRPAGSDDNVVTISDASLASQRPTLRVGTYEWGAAADLAVVPVFACMASGAAYVIDFETAEGPKFGATAGGSIQARAAHQWLDAAHTRALNHVIYSTPPGASVAGSSVRFDAPNGVQVFRVSGGAIEKSFFLNTPLIHRLDFASTTTVFNSGLFDATQVILSPCVIRDDDQVAAGLCNSAATKLLLLGDVVHNNPNANAGAPVITGPGALTYVASFGPHLS